MQWADTLERTSFNRFALWLVRMLSGWEDLLHLLCSALRMYTCWEVDINLFGIGVCCVVHITVLFLDGVSITLFITVRLHCRQRMVSRMKNGTTYR